jgi:hypothetical protein
LVCAFAISVFLASVGASLLLLKTLDANIRSIGALAAGS